MTPSLDDLTRLAQASGPGDALVRSLLAALQDISGLESVFLTRVDRPQDTCEIAYAHNSTTVRHPVPEGNAVPWSQSTCNQALAEGLAVTHTARDQWPHLEVVDDLSITTYAIEPIRDDAGSVVGTLCVVSDRRKPVSSVTREAMKLVAQLVAPRLGGSPTATAAGAMDALTARVMRDNLTGLPTRAALAAELATALARGERVCLAMVDLVGVEELDAREGHWGADRFLYTASQRLVASMATEAGTTVARYDDRAFAVMIRLPVPADAAAGVESGMVGALRGRLAEAARGQFEVAWSPVHYEDAVVVAVCADAGEEAQALLGRAEHVMREAGASAPG